MAGNGPLKKKILEEMSVSYANTLEKNFALAKEFFRITSTGTVDLIEKEKLTGTEKILIYLIGKVYAKEAGLASSEYVINQELCNELGIKVNSVLPWLKTLRDDGKINQKDNNKHSIKVNFIESILKEIEKKRNRHGN